MELSKQKSAFIKPEITMCELDVDDSILQESITSSAEDVLDGIYL